MAVVVFGLCRDAMVSVAGHGLPEKIDMVTCVHRLHEQRVFLYSIFIFSVNAYTTNGSGSFRTLSGWNGWMNCVYTVSMNRVFPYLVLRFSVKGSTARWQW